MRAFLYAFMVAICAASVSAGTGINTSIRGFIENSGQWPDEVLYVHRGTNLNTWITTSGMVMDQYKIDGTTRTGQVVRLTWTKANPQNFAVVGTQGPTVRHYINRGGSAATVSRTYESLRFSNVFPGVDVLYYLDNTGRLRYDLDVEAGAHTEPISFAVKGENGMSVRDGEVTLDTDLGGIVITDLYAYVMGDRERATPAAFRAAMNGIEFSIPERKVSESLRIDPVVYGTYIGGPGTDEVKNIALGADHLYVVGSTFNLDFPETSGKYSKSVTGGRDGFIAAISKDLSKLVGYTYVGGSGPDEVTAVTIDQNSMVCVTGNTESTNFPITIGSVGQVHKGQTDAFICRFSADLANMDISTFVGGNKEDKAYGIAVDKATGAIYVCGSTTSNANFPVSGAHQQTLGGEMDGFLVKLAPGGGTFVFSTYFGRTKDEVFTAIAVDASGFPFVTGWTSSSDFETQPSGSSGGGWGWWKPGARTPYDATYNGGDKDAFLIKFFPDGTLSKKDDGTFSTYFGGAGEEEGRGIYIDAQGRPLLVGVTNSTKYPTAGTITADYIGGKSDIFMCQFTDDGKALTACTYFGGTGEDWVNGIVADPSLNSGILWGYTNSMDFPIQGAGASAARTGSTDAFLANINPYAVKFSSLVGGYGTDTAVAAVVDGAGDIYFVLRGTSDDLTVHPDAWKQTKPGEEDGYVAKWAQGTLDLVSPTGGESICAGSNRTISWAAEGMLQGDKYLLRISSDSGKTWTDLAKDLTGMNYTWKPAANMVEGTQYRIELSSPRGHVSRSGTFSISNPPAVHKDPVSTSACEGEDITLAVEAQGIGLKYQWRRNGTTIQGATNPTLKISKVSADNSGNYDCVVSGACSPAATTKPAIVGVAAQTEITQQPVATTVDEGKKLTLTVVAKGSELTYSWSRNGKPIANADKATYTVAAASGDDAGDYTCTVTGGCGTKTTDVATVIVNRVGSVQTEVAVPGFAMHINGPVPASEKLSCSFTLNADAEVMIRFFGVDGSVVSSVMLGRLAAGTSTLMVPVSNLTPGVYGIEAVRDTTVLRTAIHVVR